MRLKLIAAVSTAALFAGAAMAQEADMHAGAEAQAQAPAAAAAAGEPTDAELAAFAGAMERLQTVAQQVQGGQPTPEQQAEMAAAVEASGLEIDRFNTISQAISTDPVLQARVAVAATPASPEGSVAAGVTDAEAAQFARAMGGIAPIAQSLNGAAPSAEQQAEMAAAIEGSGLTLDRFNQISGAIGQDQHLQARVGLAAARNGQ
ncbi:DUF4168 domain-containing protein [Brevundimonas sp.]|uniref:DUF4168 domain-containing protein n=1 Tax=Brevundimonas sp. TaxID=1871086 RepID=UPI001D551AA6|nr:DUF4168 domain-containing protein [Brevundimonas sp.]MBA4001216.1 hypothetical protein [Brevundimonas sp.]